MRHSATVMQKPPNSHAGTERDRGSASRPVDSLCAGLGQLCLAWSCDSDQRPPSSLQVRFVSESLVERLVAIVAILSTAVRSSDPLSGRGVACAVLCFLANLSRWLRPTGY